MAAAKSAVAEAIMNRLTSFALVALIGGCAGGELDSNGVESTEEAFSSVSGNPFVAENAAEEQLMCYGFSNASAFCGSIKTNSYQMFCKAVTDSTQWAYLKCNQIPSPKTYITLDLQ